MKTDNHKMNAKTVLIVGATGGIGGALLEQLINSNQFDKIFATYHNRQPTLHDDNVIWLQVDVTLEASIKKMVKVIRENSSHLDWVINAVGILHTDSHQPEKAIRQFEPDFFMLNMRVNALPSLLLAKHLKPLLKSAIRESHQPAIFATISARVGSISDNRVGGWYSYRMSKTALNMGMKTLAIEWGRSLKNVCVVVLQPGTVDTDLSKPFQGNVAEDKLFSADDSATKLVAVLQNLQGQDTGLFLDWADKRIEW